MEDSRSSQYPPPYSASGGPSRPLTSPGPPSVEKGRDIGKEFTPVSAYRDDRNARPAPSSSWQSQNNGIRVAEVEPKRMVPTPIQPPKPPVRQFPVPSVPAPPPVNSALSMPPPPLPWQQQQQQQQQQSFRPTPAEPKKQQVAPKRPKPPTRQLPAEIAAIMDKGDGQTSEPKQDGEQWIKELRKSTSSKPTTFKPASGGYPSGKGSNSSDFRQVRDGWARSDSKPPPGKTTGYKKKPLPPPPPPLPQEPDLYVNLDDIDGDDNGCSDDDDSEPPPPYVPRPGGLHPQWAPQIKTPVNIEALGRPTSGIYKYAC